MGKLERQTKATEEAANAAYGSVVYAEAQLKLMVEKERARLKITPGTITVTDVRTELVKFFYLNATLRIRNIGTSRAYITSSGGKVSFVESGNELSEDLSNLSLPDQFFDPDINRTDLTECFFPKDDTSSMKMVADAIQDHTQTAYLYGFIEYETLGGKWRREFGYRWDPFSALSMLGGLYGTSTNLTDAGRIESGHWVPTERDKPEYPIVNEHISDLMAETEVPTPPDRPWYRFWEN
ncbi:MAG TPA: hypothetical protein VGU67_13965 [Edaphobacter sp.]|nr:hypothetical protein [Edaphobacter sp.]